MPRKGPLSPWFGMKPEKFRNHREQNGARSSQTHVVQRETNRRSDVTRGVNGPSVSMKLPGGGKL